jgi:PHP family Zn ribbon phosphoesterase
MGNEVAVLIEAQAADIARVAGERVAQGVERVRAGAIQIVPGYDGEYGQVAIWPESQGKLLPGSCSRSE